MQQVRSSSAGSMRGSSDFFVLPVFFFMLIAVPCILANFLQDFTITWGPNNAHPSPDGMQLSLSLDKISGSAFASKQKYLFGQINMDMKLVAGNSAGTVTTFYLHSETERHDEVDLEFLGNVSGQPFQLQTNIFNSGTGGREQRIFLWFDPTSSFHTYSVLWTPHHLLILVDGTPIRVFPNMEAQGIPYLNKQAMGVFASIWNGESWATRGGLDKIQWSGEPFTSSYANYKVDACLWVAGSTKCPPSQWWTDNAHYSLTPNQQSHLLLVQQKYMVYNYCTDAKRYPQPPLECRNTF